MTEVSAGTLTDFLLRRIDDDEASLAEHGQDFDYCQECALAEDSSPYSTARLLAECEAKRRIVALHGGEPYPNPEDELVDTACTSFGADLRWPDECKTLMLLALPYADHAEFNPAWRL